MVQLVTHATADVDRIYRSDDYDSYTKTIASLMGHETLPNQRCDREENVRRALCYSNREAGMGLDAFDVEVMTLLHTALAEVVRYTGEEALQKGTGENSSTHSLQGVGMVHARVSEALRFLGDSYHRGFGHINFVSGALSSPYPASAQQLMLHAQLGCLGMLVHDLGENLGEFCSAAQKWDAEKAGNDSFADKSAAETAIFEHLLRLAVKATQHSDKQSFYAEVDRLRAQLNIMHADGTATGKPVDVETLRHALNAPVSLNAAGEEKVASWKAIYDVAEGHANPLHAQWEGAAIPFLYRWIKSIDHLQGCRHLLLHKDDAGMRARTVGQVQQNLRYFERDVGPMMEALGTQPNAILHELAKRQAAAVYATASAFCKHNQPTAIGYALARHTPDALPDSDLALKIRAQGALAGLYSKAAQAALTGDFTPSQVNGEWQILGIHGLLEGQKKAISCNPNDRNDGVRRGLLNPYGGPKLWANVAKAEEPATYRAYGR